MGFVKVLLAIFLGLLGLLMTTCGMIFTVASGGKDVIVLSIPSLVIGLLLLYCTYRLARGKPAPPKTEPEVR